MNPRIAVITPYFKEHIDVLWQCHRSVLDQQLNAAHFMIADGFPLAEIDDWQVQHVKLPQAHGDNGDTPRGLGSLLAKVQGYDFIAYLDADNWYHAGHLQSLLTLHQQTGNPICSSLRSFHALSGEQLAINEPEEDSLRHVDTSCFLIHKSNFDLLGVWLDIPKVLAPICDRVFLASILHKRRVIRSTGQRTVAFRTQYANHYRAVGAPIPNGAKETDFGAGAVEYLRTQQGVTESVAAMGFWPLSYMATP